MSVAEAKETILGTVFLNAYSRFKRTSENYILNGNKHIACLIFYYRL